jgi:hypothetical protein
MNELKDGHIEIEIPFDGFYETYHDRAIDDAVESHFQDDGGDLSDEASEAIWSTNVDWKAIKLEYVKEFTSAFASEFELDLQFSEMTSPREYNFSTDRIFASIPKVQIDKIRKEVESYPTWSKIIKDRFTSYDGFSSNYSNDSKDPDWTADILDECQYRVILEAWIEHKSNAQHIDYDDYYIASELEVYAFDSISDAVDLIEKEIKKVKKG